MATAAFKHVPEAEVRASLNHGVAEALIQQGARQLNMQPSELEVHPVVCMPQHKSSVAYHEWMKTTCSKEVTFGTLVMNPVTFVQTFHSASDTNPIKTWMTSMQTHGHPCPKHVAWTAIVKQQEVLRGKSLIL